MVSGRYCVGGAIVSECAIVVGVLLCRKHYYVWGTIVSGALLCWWRYCVWGAIVSFARYFDRVAILLGALWCLGAILLGALLCQGLYCLK